MQVSEKYYDEIFHFKGLWDLPSCCGLKVLRGEKTVVIVTELYQDNPGISVASAGKSLAEQICLKKGLDINKIVYLECNPATGSKLSFYSEEIFQVEFSGGAEPAYRQLSADEVRQLCGFPEGLE